MSRALYLLLGLVAVAAAVLSFDALLQLAVLVGFRPVLAWLLPLAVDLGACAGTLVWLREGPATARRFGRALALTLLTGSVAGNALGHGLVAFAAAPSWWLVSAVSAVPPAVLGAVVHLAVLAGRDEQSSETGQSPASETKGAESVRTLPPDGVRPISDLHQSEAGSGRSEVPVVDRVDALLAEGAGRRRLARELDITEHQARELIAERRNGHPVMTR